MSSGNYSLETLYEIWRDDEGSHIEVGPDRDGLDLIEIRTFEKNNEKPLDRILLEPEQAKLLAEALIKAVGNVEVKK